MRSLAVLLFIAALAFLTCGCVESSPAQPAVTPTPLPATPVTTTLPATVVTPSRTASVSDNTITIVKNTFRPATITVHVGSTVRWVNADDHPHRIEFEDKSFSTSTYLLGSSQSASSLPFSRPGVYNYSCMIHPEMQGYVTVEG